MTLHWVAELFAFSTYMPKWPELCTVANNGAQWPTLMCRISGGRREGIFHTTVTLLARFVGWSALAIWMAGKIFGRTSV